MQSQPDELVGTLVAERYRVLSPLGRGGMGTVYLGEHEAIKKRVALKILHAEYSAKPDLVERFKREAISASRIKHPNVLDVFDFGRLDNGCFYLAMEFLEGHDLADELERKGVLPADRALRIALQICKALATAHSRGVVHRDLKPENVFLHATSDGDEIVKIVDFGIAQLRTTEEVAESEPRRRRLTRTGMIFGTPEYMSPEQARGVNADHRVDVYATGVILYEMFCGSVPFTGETFFAVLQAHLLEPIPSLRTLAPEVSEELDALIQSALSKEPDARPQSMSDFAHALRQTPEGAELRGSSHSLLPPTPDRSGDGPPRAATDVQFDRRAQVSTADTQPEAAHAGARAVTALDATTAPRQSSPSVPQPPRSSAGKIALGVVGLLGVLGIGAFALGIGRSEPEPTAAQAPSAEADEPVRAAPAPTDSAPTIEPGVTKISLEVVTEPAGATVYKNGAQVCDESPCTVLADLDEELELEAQHGKSRGKKKVLAQRDQKVDITLAAPKVAPAPKARQCFAEVMRDGIKMIEPVPCKP